MTTAKKSKKPASKESTAKEGAAKKTGAAVKSKAAAPAAKKKPAARPVPQPAPSKAADDLGLDALDVASPRGKAGAKGKVAVKGKAPLLADDLDDEEIGEFDAADDHDDIPLDEDDDGELVTKGKAGAAKIKPVKKTAPGDEDDDEADDEDDDEDDEAPPAVAAKPKAPPPKKPGAESDVDAPAVVPARRLTPEAKAKLNELLMKGVNLNEALKQVAQWETFVAPVREAVPMADRMRPAPRQSYPRDTGGIDAEESPGFADEESGGGGGGGESAD